MTTTTHVTYCPECDKPVTSHAPGCKLSLVTTAAKLKPPAPGALRSLAEIIGPPAPTNGGKPKMRWSMFEKYLTAIELQGKRARLTIDRIEIETTHTRPSVTEEVPVLYFREVKRGLVLSHTNRRALAKAFGDDVEACIGKQILVEAVAVQVAGRDQTPIRITAPAPAKVDTKTGEVTDGGR